MKFSQYILLTENKAQPISDTEAEHIIQTKCQQVVTNDIKIYRGMPTSSQTYLFGDAKFITPRISANTSNYYTLIVDNTPEWAQFPKRSKSYICTTELRYARNYGIPYQVLPLDNAKLGICSGDDFWYSFSALEDIGINNLDDFNMELGHILFYLYNQQQYNDQSFQNIKNGCEAVDQYLTKINYNYNKLPKDFDKRDIKIIQAFTFNKRPILQGIMSYLSPLGNGFKCVNIANVHTLPEDVEIWTDSPCIFKKIS